MTIHNESIIRQQIFQAENAAIRREEILYRVLSSVPDEKQPEHPSGRVLRTLLELDELAAEIEELVSQLRAQGFDTAYVTDRHRLGKITVPKSRNAPRSCNPVGRKKLPRVPQEPVPHVPTSPLTEIAVPEVERPAKWSSERQQNRAYVVKRSLSEAYAKAEATRLKTEERIRTYNQRLLQEDASPSRLAQIRLLIFKAQTALAQQQETYEAQVTAWTQELEELSR